MGKKYIVEMKEGERLYKTKLNALNEPVIREIVCEPYTEPDLEQVRKEAYDKCMDEAEMLAYKLYSPKIDEAYQRGLSDAWDAARKIQDTGGNLNWWIHNTTATEAIEKIRQYEQEKDRQARIEYNFDEVKDVIETIAKEYNMSFDEIAEVLKKMGEH